jgi:uncharacterized phage protein gp47/JayE
MPVQDGEYKKLSAEEIQERLENNLEEKFDTTAQPGDLVTRQLAAEAETLAENQEEALRRVHQAAYLADATGEELDKVVDIIGLSRNTANPSTGTVKFYRETPPTSTYTIPNGATVQTSGTDQIEFNTTEQDSLRYISGFEDGNLNDWNGEVASFSILNTSAMSGNYALEVPATADVNITTEQEFGVGTTFGFNINLSSGSSTAIQFGKQDASNYLECVVDENAQDFKIRTVEEGSETGLFNNNSATIPSGQSLYMEITWGLYKDTEAVLYETNNRENIHSSVSLNENIEWESGSFGITSKDSTATALVDELSTRSVHINIEANENGTVTNVGPNTITTIGTSLAGVESVTNPKPTGSPKEINTNFSPFVLGEETETDEELRERAFNSTSIGGSATVNAIDARLREIEGVKALTLNRNRKNTMVDGMPSKSFEVIIYGGSDEDVGRAIFETASIDSNDVGGINGVGASYTINSSVTKESEVINFSRPNEVNLDIELDLIVDENFIGEIDIRSIIVNYIGGTGVSGDFVNGLDVGEDIYKSVLARKLVDPEETGVWEVDNISIDKDQDGTNDIETTTSGAEVLAVSNNEVALTNARDGSITITTTQK